jgi:ABC-type nitrate/sulfonate/bicarbonate transport system substrate-binding protein
MAAPVIAGRFDDHGGTMLRVKQLLIGLACVVAFAPAAVGQSLPKVRAAYTSIGIQFDPVYIMKELDLPRKHGVDAEILFVPVSSRAVQAALAGEIQFITSAGVANINANVSGGDFVASPRLSILSCSRFSPVRRSKNPRC